MRINKNNIVERNNRRQLFMIKPHGRRTGIRLNFINFDKELLGKRVRFKIEYIEMEKKSEKI